MENNENQAFQQRQIPKITLGNGKELDSYWNGVISQSEAPSWHQRLKDNAKLSIQFQEHSALFANNIDKVLSDGLLFMVRTGSAVCAREDCLLGEWCYWWSLYPELAKDKNGNLITGFFGESAKVRDSFNAVCEKFEYARKHYLGFSIDQAVAILKGEQTRQEAFSQLFRQTVFQLSETCRKTQNEDSVQIATLKSRLADLLVELHKDEYDQLVKEYAQWQDEERAVYNAVIVGDYPQKEANYNTWRACEHFDDEMERLFGKSDSRLIGIGRLQSDAQKYNNNNHKEGNND